MFKTQVSLMMHATCLLALWWIYIFMCFNWGLLFINGK